MREYHAITAAAASRPQALRRHFTMVELMVVIVIASIILAFSVPAFQKLAVGSGVDAAARMLSSQLSLARAEAISRRQYIAVIMPGQHFNKDTDDENIYRYQSFRAAIVTHSGGTYTFEKWVEGTEWSFLPTGTVIAEADDDAYTSGSNPVAAGTDTYELIDTASSGSPIQLEIPVDSDDNPRWKIEDNGLVVITDPSGPSVPKIYPGKSNTQARAVIFKPNGRCVQKTYVTILEGVVPEGTASGASSEDSIQRENKFNIRVMEINAFTGQIRYLF